jgi:putative membrane protein
MEIAMNRANKVLLAAVAAALACMPLQAQMRGTGASPAGSPSSTPGQNPALMNNGMDSGPGQDAYFLKKAAAGGNSEVALGRLALDKSSNDDVKKFAQKMVDDHTAMGQDLQTVAKGLNVDLPTGPSSSDKKEFTKLQSLSGPAFDKEYVSYMVKDHKKDLSDFKSENASTQNGQVKDLTSKGASIISQHLQMAETLEGQVGKG